MLAVVSLHTTKCCHLVSEYGVSHSTCAEAYARSLYSDI